MTLSNEKVYRDRLSTWNEQFGKYNSSNESVSNGTIIASDGTCYKVVNENGKKRLIRVYDVKNPKDVATLKSIKRVIIPNLVNNGLISENNATATNSMETSEVASADYIANM